MPVSYHVEEAIVVVTLEGDYSVEELQAGVEGALSKADGPPRAGLLLDQRRSTAISSRSVDDLKRMADFLVARRDAFSSRIANVTGGPLAFGVTRMGAAFTEQGGLEALVTRDMEEARRWLLEPRE